MKTKLFLFAAVIVASLTSYSQENEIPDAGNVGIGTTTPTEKLDVRGGARIDSTLHVGDSLVIANGARVGDDLTVSGNAYFKNNASVISNFDVQGKSILNQTAISGDFYILNLLNQTNLSNYDVLLRDHDGKIVKSSIGTMLGTLYSLQCITENGVVQSPTWSNAPDKLFIGCPEVYVGIGTTSPLFRLDVRGKGYFSTSVQAGNVTANNYSNVALYEGMKTEDISGPLMRLAIRRTNGTSETRFRVEADGTVYCTEVRVRPTTAIPDYVFKPSYNLMPIAELRTYLNTNSHLPNIPSEQEIIEQGGTNVNEMQMKLLEKVEELTLYILQLDQRNVELEKKIQELQILQTKQQ